LELRLDVIPDITSSKANEIIKSIKEITQKPIILTNRTKKEGGFFEKTEEERIKILSDNAHLVEITDIELSTDEELRQRVIDNANKTIISYHNFQETPGKDRLQEIIDCSFKIGDIPKIAVKPNKMEDTYTILELLIKNQGIIAISMDKLGSYTRVIGPVMGAPVTYAAINNESAPGQLDIRTTSEMIKKLKNWFNMNTEEKTIIKSLNKLGVDTRFISLYNNDIYINNLKFSKFSRKKEDDFRKQYPDMEVVRSKLFQKICIKVSRTVKNQIKPQSELYIENNDSLENILLYIVLEPYKRKYGIKIVDQKSEYTTVVSNCCQDDFCMNYLNLMTKGEKIENNLQKNTIYPLKHVKYQWMLDWMDSSNITYSSKRDIKRTTSNEIIDFLEKHIPNVQESIIQSVNYLEENNQKQE